jgi:Ca2+-binding RTX toxin-like protein
MSHRLVFFLLVTPIMSVCLFAQDYDGPAELPIATVASSMADTPAPGAVITVNAGANLQAALNSAQCGNTVELQAGATFTGNFVFPALNCDSNHWIIIRTSARIAVYLPKDSASRLAMRE